MEIKEINNLVELLNNSASLFPDNIALSIGDKFITYKELKILSEKLTSYLQAYGIKKGDHIAILSENRPEWGIAFFGIIKVGATAVCMDSFLKEKEIEFILRDSESVYIFASETFVQILKDISGSLSNLKGIIELSEIHKLEVDSFSEPEIDPDDIAILIYTSGTMGSQKGVMLSHGNIVSNTSGAFERILYKPGINILSLLPLSHMFGVTAGFLVPLYNGARVTYSPSLKGYEILDTMQQTKTNVMVVVPLMLRIFYKMINEKIEQLSPFTKRLVKLNFAISKFFRKIGVNSEKLLFKKIHNTFGGHLSYFICGGAPLEPEIEEYFYTLGIPVLTGYGLTETSPIVSVNTLKERKIGSVGKLLPQVEVRVTEEGEILVKGHNVMKGYYKNESATKEVLRSGWFHTGDIGEIDIDGFLYIKGRKKNVIVTSSGLKIFPEEIETQVSKSPYIKEVCILGRKVEKGEQAYGVICPDYALLEGMRKEEIITRIKEELEEYQKDLRLYKKVLSFEIWDKELPKTTTRKIKRKLLMDVISKRKPEEVEVKEVEEMNFFASKIRSIVAKIADIPESSIGWQSNFVTDLGIDSLMKIEVLCTLDKELGVYIPEEYSYQIETFRDLVLTTQKYSEAPGAVRADFLFSDTKGDLSDIIKENPLLKITRFISSVLLFLISKFYFNLRVKHRDKVPKKGSFIVASNHTSLLDFPLIYISLPPHAMRDTVVPAAKDYFFRNPFTSLLIHTAFNAFPLERYGNFFEGLKICAKVIQSEKPLILFPEGTRSIKGALQPFKSGIGLLSFELNVPVLPVYIRGAYEALPKGAMFPVPRPIEVRFGNPIIPQDYKKFKDKIPNYKIYQKIIEELRKRVVALMKEE